MLEYELFFYFSSVKIIPKDTSIHELNLLEAFNISRNFVLFLILNSSFSHYQIAGNITQKFLLPQFTFYTFLTASVLFFIIFFLLAITCKISFILKDPVTLKTYNLNPPLPLHTCAIYVINNTEEGKLYPTETGMLTCK